MEKPTTERQEPEMTKTKDQMLQNAINAVIAYKQTCKL